MDFEYLTVKKERDILKYNLEKAVGVLQEKDIEIELESLEGNDGNKNQTSGLKLIEEKNLKIE